MWKVSKRIGIVVAAVLAVILVAIITIPLVVDVDQYRPQILDIANQKLNGKLNIGKLSLSLWGKIEIDVDGVELQGPDGTEILSVKETYVNIPFLSVLKAQPQLIFRMTDPKIKVIKDKNGDLNVLKVVKNEPAEVPPAPTEEPSKPAGELPGAVQGLIASAGVDVVLVDSDLMFLDQGMGFEQELNDFNFVLKDLSLTRPTTIKVWSDVSTKMGDTLEVNGPFAMNGLITPVFSGLEFQDVLVKLSLDFSKMDVKAGGVIHKSEKIPATIDLEVAASKKRVKIDRLAIIFHNAEITAQALLEDLDKPVPQVQFEMSSKPIALDAWDQLLATLKQYELEGRADLRASANGPLTQLNYTASLDVKDLVVTAPGLLARPKMQFVAQIKTNEVEKMHFRFEAPGSDVDVNATLKDFSAPKADVMITSNGIDLDQLLPKPKPEEKPKNEVGKGGAKQASETGKKEPEETTKQDDAVQPVQDVDSSLDALRSNTMLQKMLVRVGLRIKKFQGYNVVAENISADFSFKDLIASIEEFKVNVFKGLIKANSTIDLKPKKPIYKLNLAVSDLSIESAVASQMQSLQNTLLGRLSFRAQGGGQSLNSDQIMKNLNMSGNFKVDEATFATVNVAEMAVNGINEAIGDITSKLPPLKDKKVKMPADRKSRYKVVSSDFSLQSGVFLAPNFKTEAYPNEGIDVEGRTEADLLNDKLDARWMLIDTYNMTNARNVDIETNGVTVAHVLAKDDQPVGFPVEVGCKLSSPCYKYDAAPKYLVSIALQNVREAVGARAKKEINKAKKAAKAAVKKEEKKAKEKVNKELDKQKDKLKKRFGF